MDLFGYEVFLSDLRTRYASGNGYRPGHGAPEVGAKDDAPLKRGLNAIVPVSFAETDGVLFASAYPAFLPLLADFLSEYGKDPFSDCALGALNASMRETLAVYGYRQDRFPLRYAYSCLLKREDGSPDLPLPGLRFLCPEDAGTLENRISMKLSDCAARSAAAVVRDGMLLCAACVNSVSGAGKCREIGVECAPAFRGQGFGSACVSLLARTLAGRGEVPLYQYYRTNEASARTAARAGFAAAGRFFAYTAFHR